MYVTISAATLGSTWTFLTRPPHFLCSYGNFEYPVSKECQTAGQLGCQKLSGNQGCRQCADIVQHISLCLCKKVPGLQQGLKVILISVETPDHSQGECATQ